MGKTTNLQFIGYSSFILLSASLILSVPLLIYYCLFRNHFEKFVPIIVNILNISIVTVFIMSVFVPAQFGLIDGTELNRQFTCEQHIYDALRFVGSVVAAVLIFLFLKNKRNFIINEKSENKHILVLCKCKTACCNEKYILKDEVTGN